MTRTQVGTGAGTGTGRGSGAGPAAREARRVRRDLAAVGVVDRRLRADLRDRVRDERDRRARGHLAATPVEDLRDPRGHTLRPSVLRGHGLTTAEDVLRAGHARIEALPGLGPTTAAAAVRAARAEKSRVGVGPGLRIDAGSDEPTTVAMLTAAVRYDLFVRRAAVLRGARPGLDDELRTLEAGSAPVRHRLRGALTGRRGRDGASASARRLVQLVDDLRRDGFVQRLHDLAAVDRVPVPDLREVRDRFRADPAGTYALLDGFWREAGRPHRHRWLGPWRPDRDRGEARIGSVGSMPWRLLARIRAQDVDGTLLKVRLRTYQRFAAQFVLAQRRVVLGDEMGLGKTVEAVAVMAHLTQAARTDGRAAVRVLVVCPANVLVNWHREIVAHSALTPVTIYGERAVQDLARWAGHGGVAVTTFETLRRLPGPDGTTEAVDVGDGGDAGDGPTGRDGGGGAASAVDLVVVDEAHYVKNPDALRTRAVRRWTDRAGHVLMLTGTPMENRLDEFWALLAHVDGTLRGRADVGRLAEDPVRFRDLVAPRYLRRNAADVLDELPELVRTDDWVDLSFEDRHRYAHAASLGRFMDMRRAAYSSPHPARCGKTARLLEIVEQARDEGRKVVVFSYFLDVLDTVVRAMDHVEGLDRGALVGPLTGAVTPVERQRMVDRFTATDGPAVLVAQVQAGGVGLNLQAASVVVLCEPQVKPSLEAQAVARAHRMGQLRPVHVHRLLSPGTVDEWMLHLLASKTAAFDTYVRRSALADDAPDALDGAVRGGAGGAGCAGGAAGATVGGAAGPGPDRGEGSGDGGAVGLGAGARSEELEGLPARWVQRMVQEERARWADGGAAPG